MSSTYFNISDKLRLYEFGGMLDQYGDAAAAYSLRKLRNGYTGDAIRVRRSGDNAERDMGFYDNELDTQALLDWVNTEYVKYTSDFSSDNEGWSAAGGTSDGNIDGIDGQDDCLRLTADTSTGNHRLSRANLFRDRPNSFRIELDYYIPSTNIDANSIKILTSGGNTDFLDVLDTWTSATLDTGTVPSGYFYITMYASGTNLFTGNGSDVIYVKNIRVTQTTSSGHVHTWYDQSANANHAVQGTESAQPKIVDAGSLVTDNGKPAITYDDVDDFFSINSLFTNVDGEHAVYSVTNQNNLAGTILGITGSGGYYFRYTSNNPSSLLWYLPNTTGAAMALIGPTGQGLISLNIGGGTAYAYVNNVLNNSIASTGPLNNYPNGIGRYASGEYFGGYMQEIVAYETNTISNRNDINTNINDFYNIY
jgi:hypothetical protein